ncbi:MAG: putative bifunctional diguanylate cyclase/phosphodiesterase, partial [Myxococcales bacterium]|nr:EAL domain-containing protein [Myxococcales bacterium]
HPRLRRQLESAGRAQVPAEWKKLVEAIDATYRAADADKALLEDSVRALTALLARAQSTKAQSSERKSGKLEKAARAARRLARALDKSALAVLEVAPDLTIRSANAAAAKICGVSDLAGRALLSAVEPLDAEAIAEKWRRKLSRGVPVARTLACSARDGRALACDFVLLPRVRKDGKLGRVTVVLRDETSTVEKQDALQKREERYALALAGAAEVVWDWDLRTSRLTLSPRWREILGLSSALSGTPSDWLDRVHPEDGGPLRAALAAHFEGRTTSLEHEHRIRHADGDWRWLSVRGAAKRDANGAAVRVTGLMSDITRHRLLVERMAHDARHDALTGLPNRTLFLDLLRHSFYRTRRHEDYRFAVLFIDIDRFKTVNDAFGHETGDLLLQQIARRLESCLREGDTLARHGGDEFTMWLDDVRGAADAIRVADRVHEVMRDPFDAGGQKINSSASIGAAVGSSTYKQAEDVLRDADVAMYRAKALGKARTSVFQRDPNETPPPSHLQMETDLRSALLRNELLLHYMPIVDVQTGKVKGLEALARWQHPRLGLVQPAKFLSLAVETGLIVSIDQWVLRTASRQLYDWRRELAGAAKLSISVNFSQKLLEERDLGTQIDRVLRDSHLAPADLNLDINESSLNNGDAPSRGMIAELHQRGLGLHMDDFGTGKSWLRHLHASEVDSIKIDRSFLSERQILSRLVSMARELGKKVIAEGVETAEQLRLVREVGCEQAQGFFFTPPLDVLKARSLLQGGVMDVV